MTAAGVETARMSAVIEVMNKLATRETPLLSQEACLRAWRAGGVVPKQHPARLRHWNHPASLRSAPLLTRIRPISKYFFPNVPGIPQVRYCPNSGEFHSRRL